jgi:HTH-type transcriptional regulator / antitoxin HipB
MPKIKLKPAKSFVDRAAVKDSAQIGEIVRQLRKDSKLTQQEAAALCNVGTRFLSDLENGKASAQLGKVLQVLHAFGLLVILKKKTLTDE